MRQMVLVMTLLPEEQAVWQGRDAMVVAVNDDEREALKSQVIGVHGFLAHNLKCLRKLKEVLESTGGKEGHVRRVLDSLLEPARAAEAAHDATRETLDRAAFVGPKKPEGRVH